MAEQDPIGGHGFIGDTRTGGLVDGRGNLVWLCLPHFDGEPVFGELVAGPGGGSFRLGPADTHARPASRRYRPGSAVLETTWEMDGAQLVLTEGMVADVAGQLLPGTCLVRRLEARGGPVQAAACFDPRVGLGRRPMQVRRGLGGLVCTGAGLALTLAATSDLVLGPGAAVAFDLEPGSPLTVVLGASHRGPAVGMPPRLAWQALIDDEARWRRWSDGIAYDGPFAEAVGRSLLTLRLLTFSPSGAPVAAPTTSLPELVGGGRNWDYRYAWPRDASIGIGAFLGSGLDEQAKAFLAWLLHATRRQRPRLPSLLTLYGREVPAEHEAEGWAGYAGSRPVRFGNGASTQHQLDGYGWVLDAIWLLVDAGHHLYGETWRAATALADFVAEQWRLPDAGIWEVRGEPRHYVHSKLMGWLALDRALRMAATQRTSAKRRARWAAARDALAADIRANGFDAEANTFVRAYGSRDTDAALLVLPLLGIEPPGSRRVLGTIEAVRRELSAGGPHLYRYPPGQDGLAGAEGAFLPCSFWFVQALAATGQVDEAVERFEQLLALGGPLGLLSEEADPATGALLGNYPQAFTHATLVQAALAIRDATTTAAAAATATTDAAAGRGRRRTRRGPPS